MVNGGSLVAFSWAFCPDFANGQGYLARGSLCCARGLGSHRHRIFAEGLTIPNLYEDEDILKNGASMMATGLEHHKKVCQPLISPRWPFS
jgi:hypothetical protein